MQYIYFSTVDGGMVDNYDIVRMAKVVYDVNIYPTDFVEIRKFANQCEGICKEINPSVKYLVKNGRKAMATMVYHRKHLDISLADCKKVIDDIEKSLNKNKEN